jgi:hypothetical protein
MVFAKLAGPFPSPAFTRLPQVRNGTGFSRRKSRTADALIVSTYPSRGLYLAGVEIKVSKSDWRKELADPDKQSEIGKYCREWYVAAPAGVIPHAEVPATWGIVECDSRGANITRAAKPVDFVSPDMLLICSILRAAESVHVDYVHRDDVNEVAETKVKSATDAAVQVYEREIDQLKRSISVFEDASGVKIDRWCGPNVGAAVKMVLESGADSIFKQAERIVEAGELFRRRLVEIRSGDSG